MECSFYFIHVQDKNFLSVIYFSYFFNFDHYLKLSKDNLMHEVVTNLNKCVFLYVSYNKMYIFLKYVTCIGNI